MLVNISYSVFVYSAVRKKTALISGIYLTNSLVNWQRAQGRCSENAKENKRYENSTFLSALDRDHQSKYFIMEHLNRMCIRAERTRRKTKM